MADKPKPTYMERLQASVKKTEDRLNAKKAVEDLKKKRQALHEELKKYTKPKPKK